MNQPIATGYERIVLCMKWGIKYNAEYVNRLFRMLERHLSLPFRLVCLTDDASGILPAVSCFPIPEFGSPTEGPERGWNKLSVFKQDLYGLEGQALFLDLDIVIVDNIDAFFLLPGGCHIIRDWRRPWRGVGNSSVYRFSLGQFPDLLPHFVKNSHAIRKRFRNEQAYLSWYINREDGLSFWPDAWCKSFKYHCIKPFPLSLFISPAPPEKAKIIVFHGEINPYEAIRGGGGKWYRFVLPSPWIEKQWR